MGPLADVPLLCLLVLLALPLRCLAQSSSLSDRVFRHPLAGAAVTFILMWAMIFLPSHTMGGIGAGRLLNKIWTFILRLSRYRVSALWLAGAYRSAGSTPAIHQLGKAGKRLPLVCAVMLVCMACTAPYNKEGQDNHFATTLEAAYESSDGEAARFAKVLDKREAIFDRYRPARRRSALGPEEERPWLLFYTDVAPARTWGLTPYYSKKLCDHRRLKQLNTKTKPGIRLLHRIPGLLITIKIRLSLHVADESIPLG